MSREQAGVWIGGASGKSKETLEPRLAAVVVGGVRGVVPVSFVGSEGERRRVARGDASWAGFTIVSRGVQGARCRGVG